MSNATFLTGAVGIGSPTPPTIITTSTYVPMGPNNSVSPNPSLYEYGTYQTTNTLPPSEYTVANTGNPGIRLSQDADILLGNKSLKNILDKIEQRLAILDHNPELEDMFDELRELGEKYRSLEKQLAEKKLVWDALKQTTE